MEAGSRKINIIKMGYLSTNMHASNKLSWLLLPLFFVIIILPNSLRIVSLPLFITNGLIILFVLRQRIDYKILMILMSGALITIIYTLVGINYVGYTHHILQILFVYIVSPLLWISILSYIIKHHQIERLVNILMILIFIGALTVPVFIFLYINTGTTYLSWMIKEVYAGIDNVDMGATMHVFGVLIFGISGLLASSDIIKSKAKRVIVIITLIIAAIISGRSALLMSIGVGFILFLIYNPNRKKIEWIGLMFILFFSISIFLKAYFSINTWDLVQQLIDKISSGGGSVRAEQFYSLLDGVFSHYFLGAGHGVPAAIIQSDYTPWRYEILPLATLYRVGVFGLVIYSIPILYVIVKFHHLRLCRNQYDIFMYSGLVAICIAVFTNPYLESFEFQWMIFFPFMYFWHRDINKRHPKEVLK